MPSKSKARGVGAGMGAWIGSPLGPGGAVVGGALGGLIGGMFGKDKKKDPYAWYKANPEAIPEALAKDRDPRAYSRNRYMFDLLDEYESATQEANAANERRYQQLLGESGRLEELYKNQKYVPQDFDDFDYGAAAKKEIDIEQRYGQAESLAALNRQGLGGSTVVGSIVRQSRDAAGRSKANIEAGVRQYQAQQRDMGRQERMAFDAQRLGNIAQARAGKMGIMERKTDIGPDPQVLSQMFQFAQSRPGMFRVPTARKRARLEGIYQNYTNNSASVNSE